MTLPVVDTVLATTQAGSAIVVAAATEAAQGNARLLRTGLIAADVGTAILLVASAVHGYTRVSACRKLKGGAPATAAVAP